MTFFPRSSRRGRYWFAELALAPGPDTIGATGDNSFDVLFGRDWAVELRADDGALHAYQRQASGSWVEVTTDLPPVFGSALEADARRVSVAFDQSARLIVAYETGGVVKVTRWDSGQGQYLQNVSFDGADPALLMDATLRGGRVPGSDVALFYLTPDRRGVRYRYQLESYDTEHDLLDHTDPLVLDLAQPLAYRYQLLVSDENGAKLDQVLVSDLYEVFAGAEELSVPGAAIAGGVYDQVSIRRSPDAEALSVPGAAIAGGDYSTPTVSRSTDPEALTVPGAAIAGGVYTQPTVTRNEAEALTVPGAAIAGGDYVNVTVTHDADPEALTVPGAAIGGGTYATP